jgi:dolichol kinase
MLIFTSKKLVLPAIGFLAFGDTMAALGGQKWGKHPWKHNPAKTIEGSICFAIASAAWAMLFVKWHVAILSAVIAAGVESRKSATNDNLWIPLASGGILSLLNLALGRL